MPIRAPEVVIIPFLDKIIHTFAYMLLSFLTVNTLCKKRKARPRLISFSYAFLLGFAIEIIQHFLPYRAFEAGDIFSNSLGGSLGLFLRAV